MKKITLAAVAALTAAGSVYGANLLTNGGFENCRGKDIRGFDWMHSSKHKFYEVDTTVKHSGKNSLKVGNIVGNYIAFTTQFITLDKFTKPLMIRGWAKYENLKTRDANGKLYGLPFIGIWGTNMAGRNSQSINVGCFKEGSRDWFYFERVFTPEEFKKRSAHLVGDKAVRGFAFRINVANQPGTVWFDDLEYLWIEPEAVKASLPVKDVTENSIKLELTVSDSVKDGKVTIAVDNKDVLKDQVVKTGKNTLTVNLDGVADGKHKMTIKPVAGFAADVKAIELDFTKQPDAFAE